MAALIHILILTAIFIILGVSLNVALGYTGLINLGHVAFFGVGAYTSAILTKMYDVPFVLAFLIAGGLAAVFGWALMKATHKLKGDYLALATLGFAFMAHSAFLNWKSLTRGPLGIPGIPRPSIFGFTISSGLPYLFFTLAMTGLCVWVMYRIVASPYGRLLQAVRDDAIGVEARGKDVSKLKVQAMMISAFFAGIAGSIYAHYITFIDPSTFHIADIVILLTIVLVGGIASIRGSVVAAAIVIMLPELLRFIDVPSTVIGPLRQMIYTGCILLILLLKPRGIFGTVDLE